MATERTLDLFLVYLCARWSLPQMGAIVRREIIEDFLKDRRDPMVKKDGMKITRVSMLALEQLREQSMGYCAACGKWTTGCCEPDARRYPCDKCGERQVYGADEAGLMGLIDIIATEE